jgi:hypothetical protein
VFLVSRVEVLRVLKAFCYDRRIVLLLVVVMEVAVMVTTTSHQLRLQHPCYDGIQTLLSISVMLK